MSKRAEGAAIKAYPEKIIGTKNTPLDPKAPIDANLIKRIIFMEGYKQAEKDTIERACDMLMNYVFEEVTPEMRDHFRKRLEEE